MNLPYSYIDNLASTIQIPEEGILSKTHYEDEHIKVVLFGFSKGQELSEHTSAKPAVLFLVEGQATIRLGNDERESSAGSLVYMPPNLSHAIKAMTKTAMLLLLIKK